MGIDVHTVEVPDGSVPLNNQDRVLLARLSVAIIAGAAEGDSVVTAVTGLVLPPSYAAFAAPEQDAVGFVSAKTGSGFTLTVNPRLATETVAAGNVDVLIYA
jgi:hypothetical protein